MLITTRAQWGARQPEGRWSIDTPTPELWLHHSAGNERGAEGVRSIQRSHMDGLGWTDIAYSFIVDRLTLEVFEGRGAGARGGHTFGRNRSSHGICVMGNFEIVRPSDELEGRLAELVRYGHGQGWWPAQFTGGHREVRPTLCPGEHLFARIPNINRRALGTGDDEMTEAEMEWIRKIQRSLVAAAIDIGNSGPNGDGVDGIPGPLTAAGVERLGAIADNYAVGAKSFQTIKNLLRD